jgi:hypothetical protein
MTNTKSFVFNVAKQSDSQKWVGNSKDAGAICVPKSKTCGPGGGCTMVDLGWGTEPMFKSGIGGDGNMFC